MKDSRGNFEKLITFTLLDYRYQLMGRSYIVDGRSRTQAYSISLYYTWGIGLQLTHCSEMLSQL